MPSLPLWIALSIVGVGIVVSQDIAFGCPGVITGLTAFTVIIGYYRKDLTNGK